MPSQAHKATIQLEPQWLNVLQDEFEKPYMQSLKAFLRAEKAAGQQIYPNGSAIFAALCLTPFDAVKIVILGQDPYHGPGQANGMAFAVNQGVAIPPSLRNIYQELTQEYGKPAPRHGDLTHWAKQGVLLLNATLTVRAGQAGSHQNQGWEQFTDVIIKSLAERKSGLVFLLWGNYAKQKAHMVDRKRHYVLDAPHPSPLSAHRGFLGSNHFRLANDYLLVQGKTPIEWL